MIFVFDVIAHTIIGLMGAATGYSVRTLCKHKGLLPHPKAHIAITAGLVAIESVFTVSLLG